MGRTKSEVEYQGNQLTEADLPGLPVAKEALDIIAIKAAGVSESFDVIKAIGRIEAAQFFTTVGDKLIAETAIQIRNGKKYKELTFTDENGNIRYIRDFQEFCTVFLGKSYSRVWEIIGNYNLLGSDLFEQAEKIGFRQQDYNALKALPSDEKRMIAQVMEDESIDKALEVIQALAAKAHRDREESLKTITDQAELLAAKDAVIDEKSQQLHKRMEQLARMEAANRKKVDEVSMPGAFELQRLSDYADTLAASITATLSSEIVKLRAVFEAGEMPAHIELAIAQALGRIITAAYGTAHDYGYAPVLDADTAADDPVKADAEAFLKWQAEQA